MLRVLIVDDQDAVRQRLQKVLCGALRDIVFGEARNAREALDLSAQEPWDLVLLDVALPDQSWLAVLKQLRRQCHGLPVLVVSLNDEALYAYVALKFGARGYVTKQSAPEELATAVRKVLAGGTYITTTLAEKLAIRPDGGLDQSPQECLSCREFEVFRCLASGMSLKEAAGWLSLSPKTVNGYRARIFVKLKLKTKAELADYAVQHGLVGTG
jgi:two-component system, NarL family, invasion response regulator UvrY